MEQFQHLLTINQAAEVAGVDRQTIYAWMRKGLLPFVWLGGRRRIKEADLVAVLRPGSAESTDSSGQQSARVAA